jgi:hypothetical protein
LPLAVGEAAFRCGRYAEAKQAFVGLEEATRSWDDRRRAEYALYRGLTALALGDRSEGGAWLARAVRLEDEHPGSLAQEDARRLSAARDANGLP